jgi:hypothetical protein
MPCFDAAERWGRRGDRALPLDLPSCSWLAAASSRGWSDDAHAREIGPVSGSPAKRRAVGPMARSPARGGSTPRRDLLSEEAARLPRIIPGPSAWRDSGSVACASGGTRRARSGPAAGSSRLFRSLARHRPRLTLRPSSWADPPGRRPARRGRIGRVSAFLQSRSTRARSRAAVTPWPSRARSGSSGDCRCWAQCAASGARGARGPAPARATRTGTTRS